MTKDTMPDRIRESRKKQKLTQQELADKVKVSLMTVLRWEKGERIPRADEINRIAEALNVSAGYLMGGEMSPAGEGMPSVKEQTQERNTNMATITLDGGRKVEAPATPEGYAFLERMFAMSLAGTATA